jgi:hypothetical protein
MSGVPSATWHVQDQQNTTARTAVLASPRANRRWQHECVCNARHRDTRDERRALSNLTCSGSTEHTTARTAVLASPRANRRWQHECVCNARHRDTLDERRALSNLTCSGSTEHTTAWTAVLASPRANRRWQHWCVCIARHRERMSLFRRRASARSARMFRRGTLTALQVSRNVESATVILRDDTTSAVDAIKSSAIRCYFYTCLEHSCKPGWSQQTRVWALNGWFLAASQKLYEIIRHIGTNKYDSLLFLQ